MSYSRRLHQPERRSFFLFGPRGVGKSTWLKMEIRADLWIDLLKAEDWLLLSTRPDSLIERTGHLKAGAVIVIDEIQKAPRLLDVVHHLIEEKKFIFALTGSSARKVRRGGMNLLAGRALSLSMYGLTSEELGEDFKLERCLELGTLPLVQSEWETRSETLYAYVETYLRQEIVEEGIIRKLDPFMRFIRVAAQYHAQVLNVENIARESKTSRTTVDQYFQILEDTLIGFRLPAFQLGIRTKETRHPKFYFFDNGVARAAAGLLNDEFDSVARGYALEAFLVQEIRAYNEYSQKRRSLYYYAVAGSFEVDLLIETTRKTLSRSAEGIALEFKSSKKWDSKWNSGLTAASESKKMKIKRRIGVYLGNEVLTHGEVEVYPVKTFLKKLWSGEWF